MSDFTVRVPRTTRSIGELVAELAARLEAASVSDARDEARDLVAALVDERRFWPALHRDQPAGGELWNAALAAAEKRARGAPFAYAVGRASFRHLTLEVDDRVLIPRQETEQLVELVLAENLPAGGLAVDIGTGSGAIALALATEGRFARVIATDVSLGALAVARRNVARSGTASAAPVELRHGSMVAPVRQERARAVVSNPPYIALGEAGALPSGVRDWEPPIALFGGSDGMRSIAGLIDGAATVLEPGGLLAVELDVRRASLAAELAARSERFDEVRVLLDLTGRERYLFARAVRGTH